MPQNSALEYTDFHRMFPLETKLPVVVLFHNFVSGEDSEYMTAFKKFIDFAASKNATFVTTMDLVEMAKRNHPNDQN